MRLRAVATRLPGSDWRRCWLLTFILWVAGQTPVGDEPDWLLAKPEARGLE